MSDTLSFSSNAILEATRLMVPAFHAAPRHARRHVANLMHEALVVCARVEGLTYDELLSRLQSLHEEGEDGR